MFTKKTQVLRVLNESTHRVRRHPHLAHDVEFVARFLESNSTLVCKLRDSSQAHRLVVGSEVSLNIVGLKEDIGALVVELDGGPELRVPGLQISLSTTRVKKRHFFETTPSESAHRATGNEGGSRDQH